MRKIIIPALVSLLLVALCITSAEARNGKRIKVSRERITKTLDIKNFSAISVSGGHNVVYTIGETSLKMDIPENLLEYIKCYVSGDVLYISYKKNININGVANTLFTVSSPKLSNISIAGSGEVTVDKFELEEELRLAISGSGRITSDNVLAKSIAASVSGSGHIRLGNTDCQEVAVNVAGSGAVIIDGNVQDASSTNGENCSINGENCSSKQRANVRDNVRATVAGSGRIKINNIVTQKGVNLAVSGSGSVVCENVVAAQLTVRVSGSGRVSAEGVDSRDVRVAISGSGSTTLQGEVCSASYQVSGSGRILTAKLASHDVIASVVGSGRIECYPINSLKATSSTSGTIRYVGEPKSLILPNSPVTKL